MKVSTYLKVVLAVIAAGFFVASSSIAKGQSEAKFAKMYIVNGKEISEAQVQELANADRIKEMRKYVSNEEKVELIKLYGARVNDSYIAVLTLYTDQEMAARPKLSKKEKDAIAKAAAEQQAKSNIASTLIHEGDMAPDFTVEMLDGTKVKLSDLRGKVVMLNFWATWCGPCMMEFQEIPEKIVKHFEGKNFVLLPISRGEKREVVESKMKSLKEKGINFPVAIDPTKAIYSLYATQYIPRNFIIDQNGKVVFFTVGLEGDALGEITKKVDELLK
jgi:Peroxiredoxin